VGPKLVSMDTPRRDRTNPPSSRLGGDCRAVRDRLQDQAANVSHICRILCGESLPFR